MEITTRLAGIVLENFSRQCPGCAKQMQPLSTLCPFCGMRTPFTKYDRKNYYEHFEMKKCDVHDSYFFYCMHPKVDSKMEDLQQVCVACCIKVFDGMHQRTPEESWKKTSGEARKKISDARY